MAVHFSYGVMGCGKSEKLIREFTNYQRQNKKAFAFLSKFSDEEEGHERSVQIRSRSGRSIPTTVIPPYANLFTEVKNLVEECGHLQAVFLDEIQFWPIRQIGDIFKINDELSIPVLCYGLLTDSNGKFFPSSERLFIFAEKRIEIKTECAYCGRKAILNLRIKNGEAVYNAKQLCVDTKVNRESLHTYYMGVCRYHYYNPKKHEGRIIII